MSLRLAWATQQASAFRTSRVTEVALGQGLAFRVQGSGFNPQKGWAMGSRLLAH